MHLNHESTFTAPVIAVMHQYSIAIDTHRAAHCYCCMFQILQDKNDEALVLLADCVSTLSARSPDAPYVFGSYASALLRAGKEQEAENYATQGLALRYERSHNGHCQRSVSTHCVVVVNNSCGLCS
jgi:hypothetical protein